MDKVDASEITITEERKLAGKIGQLASQTESCVRSPEFGQSLEASLDNLSQFLDDLVEQYPDEKFTIVTGGKSRRLVDVLLTKVAQRSSQPVQEIIQKRVRFDDEQNRAIYKPEKKMVMKNIFLKSLLKSLGDNVIFVDDHVGSGMKGHLFLTQFAELGHKAYFLSFSGETEYLTPGARKWEAEGSLFIGKPDDQTLQTGVTGLSKLLSTHVNVRLNQRLSSDVPAEFDSLKETTRRDLRKANELLGYIENNIS